MIRSLVLLLVLSFPTLAQAQDFGSIGASLVLPSTPAPLGQTATPRVAPASPSGTTQTPPTAGPGFVFRLHVGGQIGEVSVAGRRGLLYYGRAGIAVGHELYAGGTDLGRMFLSLEYDGSCSANDRELIHRHGATLSFGFPSAFLSVGGGLAVGHSFQYGGMAMGGHFTFVGGFRIGHFLVAIPFDLDVFGPATAVTIGFAIGVTT